MSACNVSKRLNKELAMITMSPAHGISAFPEDLDSLLRWKGTIKGSEGTPYEGLVYYVSMAFPPTYPMTAPTVKFETPIFHPNIDMSGNICLDILKEKWSSSYTVKSLLISIQVLLESPNNESPLNNQAAQLWNNREEFLKYVKLRYDNLPIC